MFDNGPRDIHGFAASLAQAGEAELVSVISECSRTEAATAARRLAAIAELVDRYRPRDRLRAHWACDNWDAAAAQVGAAMNVSHGKASGQMYLASALQQRLPKVAALLAEGMINTALVSMINWRTALIEDPAVLSTVDTTLAEQAIHYGRLSVGKTIQAIDAVIQAHDAAALRRGRERARSRNVVIEARNTDEATTTLWGRLYAHDAEALDRRLVAMAHGVCDDDPRTIAQRRADALGALAAGADTLACACGGSDCPARTEGVRPAGGPVIHVVAHAGTVASPVDAHRDGDAPPTPPVNPRNLFVPVERPPEPDPPPAVVPGVVLGGPVVPGPLVAAMIAAGARVKPVRHPGPDAASESGYRPSAALDEFVRCRDMTCRWPDCDRPAQFCDVDHAVAYARVSDGLCEGSVLRKDHDDRHDVHCDR